MNTPSFSHPMDELVYQAVFGDDSQKQAARFSIWQQAITGGIVPASINDFYMAKGDGRVPKDLTVPAMNIRGMAYDTARAAFSAAKKHSVGALIFEIARSEIGYTDQRPEEYTTVLMAAALREGWSGPLFVQGDHFQSKASRPGVPKEGEIETIKDLIAEAIRGGFYNIDIDMSTLVDLDKSTEAEQQLANIDYSLEITKFVRDLEPAGVTVSLGGEIGHIGGKNSTLEDLRAYVDGFNAGLTPDTIGMSKISIQTGTHHGGVVLADGTLADVSVDFGVLKDVSQVSRDEYGMGGGVQHGASTLPDEYFNQFTKSEAVEVHLATGFQNIQFEHEAFPSELRDKMYAWLDETMSDERKPEQTVEQFHYSFRKKAWGEFKQATWDMPEENKTKIRQSLEERFSFFYEQLNVVNTAELVNSLVKPVAPVKTEVDFGFSKTNDDDVSGLAD
ncbi:MAG: aldolase [Candidatus Pacebacteria bacterium]|nr:aldolase [Candidatus Paceibacterota bacterium]MBT3511574.1 aldolase [Candidatus Paceibacterota bacterium]MBT4004956.1 aldolase [Candidatus Paceibacterota bacterium]MBT4358732.1 aldolase [Candidatus Paceibacterota bacterium]MBT4680699.1 aldolase [Candidatus Paceibacterota bacterium]